MISLRPYQRESLDALYAYWQGGGGNALICIPTGGGKSLCIATLLSELLKKFPRLRVAMVTHVKELIEQNFKELIRYWPGAPVGIYSAGLNRRDTRSQILFCGIQSVWNKTASIGPVDLLVVDEAHLMSRDDSTRYGKFIAAMRDLTPDMRIVGLTATPYRLDSGHLCKGDGAMFDKIVYEANIGKMIADGYLSPLVSKATVTQFDLSGVGRRGGEFIPGQLEVAVDQDFVTKAAVAEMVAFGANRRAWLAFCTGIKHCEHVRDEIRTHGIVCEMVTGETDAGERRRSIEAFRAGQVRCLVSVGVLSTGFNVPHVDLVALLRPTLSAGLFVQQVGRALRTAPGKDDALILDYARNTARFGPVDAITIKAAAASKSDEKQIRAKECPECQTLLHLGALECPTCGHSFRRDEDPLPKHDVRADAEHSILSTGAPTWIPVQSMMTFSHEKPGSPRSMRVEYFCGLATQKEWVLFEHPTVRWKAEKWWRRMGGNLPVPATVAEAMTRIRELARVEAIQLRPNGKFFDIVAVRVQRKAA